MSEHQSPSGRVEQARLKLDLVRRVFGESPPELVAEYEEASAAFSTAIRAAVMTIHHNREAITK